MEKQLSDILIKSALIILVIIIIALLLIKRFVYFRPSSHFISTKEAYKTVQHNHLHGWLLENPSSEKIVLLCHGNTGNISYMEDKMVAIRNLGYNVLAFDYSGFGKSGNIPNEEQLYDDASSMVALLRQQYAPSQIVLYGISMGAPIAIHAARRYSIPTLILESPLPSIKILIEQKYPIISWLSFLFPEFDCASYLRGYKGRSLLMHSPTDEIIPYNSTTHLQQMVTVHLQIDGSHNKPLLPWKDIKNFIDRKSN
jgi:pimeloyl-ACP methyl ester carboxylesterase